MSRVMGRIVRSQERERMVIEGCVVMEHVLIVVLLVLRMEMVGW